MSINYPPGSAAYGVFPYSAPHGSQQVAQLNALDYWHTEDANDAGAMVNRALAAGAARYPNGFRCYLPTDLYQIGTAITLPAMDNVELVGDGWGTQLAPLPGFSGFMIVSPAAGGGVFRYGLQIRDLFLNCGSQAGVSGIDLQTTYHALVQHVRVRYCTGTAIYMDGSSGNTGAYNVIRDCTLTDGGAGIAIATNFSEWLTVEGGTISFYNQAGGIGIKSGNLNCRYIGIAIDNNDTGIQLEFAGRNVIAGCQFDRGQKRFIYLHGTQYATIVGNSFNTYNGTSGTGVLDVTDGNNAGNVVTGNTVRGASGWTNFIDEHGTVGTPANTYANNDTGGSAIVLVNGTARGNRGYNPVGHAVTQPGVPASGTAQANTTGVDCSVYVAGGTVSAVAIGGVATGLTGGEFRVPAGQTITLTYSAAPTWQWFGD